MPEPECRRGGKIVFSTIIENIKSFFQKEEELSTKPKAVPEAASEVFERPSIPGSARLYQPAQFPTPSAPQRIVDKPLPANTQSLPFSPDELRAALRVQTPTPNTRTEPSAPVALSPILTKPEEHRDISHEIAAFENELHKVHETVRPSRSQVQTIHQQPATSSAPSIFSAPSSAQQPLEQSFFDEFEQFMTREDLETEGILDTDILWRMKEFHRHRQEGKEYYLYSKDIQAAVQRRLGELKGLEHEWFDKREQADSYEKEVAIIESEIQARTADLKELLRQGKTSARLDRRVLLGQEFMLGNGRTLTSLLDLKLALHAIPDDVFSHHVNSTKNDFASWVRGTMKDNKLADELGKIRDRQQMEAFLAKLA